MRLGDLLPCDHWVKGFPAPAGRVRRQGQQGRDFLVPGLHGEVLEIGFGSGLNVPHYPPTVSRVIAIEPSDVAWEVAADRIAEGSVPVVRDGLDGQRLDLPDESVDGAARPDHRERSGHRLGPLLLPPGPRRDPPVGLPDHRRGPPRVTGRAQRHTAGFGRRPDAQTGHPVNRHGPDSPRAGRRGIVGLVSCSWVTRVLHKKPRVTEGPAPVGRVRRLGPPGRGSSRSRSHRAVVSRTLGEPQLPPSSWASAASSAPPDISRARSATVMSALAWSPIVRPRWSSTKWSPTG